MTGSLTRLRTTLKTTLSSFVVDILDARENLQSRLAPVRDGLSGTDFHFWLGSRSRSFIAPMASEGYLDETPNSSGSIILATRHRIEGSSSFSPPPREQHSSCLPYRLAHQASRASRRRAWEPSRDPLGVKMSARSSAHRRRKRRRFRRLCVKDGGKKRAQGRGRTL
jgi:hypothetical protein